MTSFEVNCSGFNSLNCSRGADSCGTAVAAAVVVVVAATAEAAAVAAVVVVAVVEVMEVVATPIDRSSNSRDSGSIVVEVVL